jgi:hypothetical protein
MSENSQDYAQQPQGNVQEFGFCALMQYQMEILSHFILPRKIGPYLFL